MTYKAIQKILEELFDFYDYSVDFTAIPPSSLFFIFHRAQGISCEWDNKYFN